MVNFNNVDLSRKIFEGVNLEEAFQQLPEIMKAAGLHPSFIHAFKKTGLLLGEDTPTTPERKKEWEDAVQEWYDENAKAEGRGE